MGVTFVQRHPSYGENTEAPMLGTGGTSKQIEGERDCLRRSYDAESKAGRGERRRQQLRLHERLREHETQPPAGFSLRRVER
eukprot:597086-Pyramimonas_sp.AAC.1